MTPYLDPPGQDDPLDLATRILDRAFPAIEEIAIYIVEQLTAVGVHPNTARNVARDAMRAMFTRLQAEARIHE